jgi:hypothetical protein
MSNFKPKHPHQAFTRPYIMDAQELKATLTKQGIDEPVSVLYRIYPGGKSECTVRIGRYFNDSGYWHVAEVL